MCDPDYKKKLKFKDVSKAVPGESPTVNKLHLRNLLANGNLESNNIYLQTACTQIVATNGVSREYIKMVIDGGSPLTFIMECVSSQYSLRVTGTHKFSIMSFGKSERAPARFCNKVLIKLRSQCTINLVTITAIEVQEICSIH